MMMSDAVHYTSGNEVLFERKLKTDISNKHCLEVLAFNSDVAMPMLY